jgi:hypothetical protein
LTPLRACQAGWLAGWLGGLAAWIPQLGLQKWTFKGKTRIKATILYDGFFFYHGKSDNSIRRVDFYHGKSDNSIRRYCKNTSENAFLINFDQF